MKYEMLNDEVFEFAGVELSEEEWDFLASLEDAPIDYPDDEVFEFAGVELSEEEWDFLASLAE